MRIKDGKGLFFLLLGLLIMLFTGCSNDTNSTRAINPEATDDLTKRLFMICGETGNMTPAMEDNEFILTLQGVFPEVHWITDRPERKSGIDTTGNFVHDTWPEIFAVTAPNAVVKFIMEDENDGLFLTLKNPVYEPGEGTLHYSATLLRTTLEEGDARLLATMEFEDPVIVILNNDKGFNFVIHSEWAALDDPGPENILTMMQEDVDDEVLWVNGAPSTLSKITTTGELKDNWETFFAGSPPNAFIFGITDTGRLKAYSMTLEGMEYSPGDNSATYQASILENDPMESVTLNSVTLIIDDLNALASQCNEYCNTKMVCLNILDPAIDEDLIKCNEECNAPTDQETQTRDCAITCDLTVDCSTYLNCLCACGEEITGVCD